MWRLNYKSTFKYCLKKICVYLKPQAIFEWAWVFKLFTCNLLRKPFEWKWTVYQKNTLIHCLATIVKWKVSSLRLLHIAINGDLSKVSCSCQWKEEMTRISDMKKSFASTQEKWWCWTVSSAHLSIDSPLSATCLLTLNKNWVSLVSVFYIISYQCLVFELR